MAGAQPARDAADGRGTVAKGGGEQGFAVDDRKYEEGTEGLRTPGNGSEVADVGTLN